MTEQRYKQVINKLLSEADELMHLHNEELQLTGADDYASLIVAQQLRALAATLNLTVQCKQRAVKKRKEQKRG